MTEFRIPEVLLDDSEVRSQLTKWASENLPDEAWALVLQDKQTGEKVRFYPLNTDAGVKLAAERFDQLKQYLPFEVLNEFAMKVANAANAFDMEVPSNIAEFLGLTRNHVVLKTASVPAELLEDQPKAGDVSNRWLLPSHKFAMTIKVFNYKKGSEEEMNLFPLGTADEVRYAAAKFDRIEKYLVTNYDKVKVASAILKAAKELGVYDEVILDYPDLAKWASWTDKKKENGPKYAFKKVAHQAGKKVVIYEFPISTPEDVIKSIELFNKVAYSYFDNEIERYKTARNIVKAAREFGVEITDELLEQTGATESLRRIWKGAASWKLDKQAFDREIQLRLDICVDNNLSEAHKAYETLSNAVDLAIKEGKEIDPIKVVEKLADYDRQFGMDRYYKKWKIAASLDQILSRRESTLVWEVDGRVITSEDLQKLAADRDFLLKLSSALGTEAAVKFAQNPIKTFKEADLKYRQILVSLADRGEIL